MVNKRDKFALLFELIFCAQNKKLSHVPSDKLPQRKKNVLNKIIDIIFDFQ